MDIQALTELVKKSALLNDTERKYWLQNIQTMTEPQLQKLESILKEADELPFGKQIEQYFTALAKTADAVPSATPPLPA